MANYDVTVTLAGKFQALSPHDKKALRVLHMMQNTISGSGTPSTSQWNTALTTARALFPVKTGLPFDAVHLALWRQAAINNTFVGAGDSASLSMAQAQYILALDDESLNALDLYLLGRNLVVLT